MKVIHLPVISIHRRLRICVQVLFACILLLWAGVGISADRDAAAEGATAAEDSIGPTVLLSYSRETFKENPISSFMYFVPLISLAHVARSSSAHNEQRVGIIACERKITSKSFKVVCEFQMRGKGFHKNTFDAADMIAAHADELEKEDTLKNMLDCITFEGKGFGRIEVTGTICGPAETVTGVDLRFNARGCKSPVTVGLYDIKPKGGRYTFENRSNLTVACVNELFFRKSDKPCMGMKIASISATEETGGFFSSLMGAIATLFVSPTKVDKLGNDTMLQFGYTLLKQNPVFTFPKAKNIINNEQVTAEHRQNRCAILCTNQRP